MRVFLIGLLVLTGCVQTENSSSQDAGFYGGGGGGGSTPFTEARVVLQVNCQACHSYGAMSEADFVNQGLVIAGDPDNSELYFRLRGSQGSNGPKDMPVIGQLSQAELAKIRDWITNL